MGEQSVSQRIVLRSAFHQKSVSRPNNAPHTPCSSQFPPSGELHIKSAGSVKRWTLQVKKQQQQQQQQRTYQHEHERLNGPETRLKKKKKTRGPYTRARTPKPKMASNLLVDAQCVQIAGCCKRAPDHHGNPPRRSCIPKTVSPGTPRRIRQIGATKAQRSLAARVNDLCFPLSATLFDVCIGT